ncbi:starvin [Carabus blaptoides fortunei]
MESPVIVEKCTNFTMPVEAAETGFPFDDSDDSQDHFQARLNDIAQRHPEFANHLRFDDFPSLRRKRYGSSSSTDQDEVRHQSPGQGPSSASSSHQFSPDSRRFGDHSFPSGFNRFPFTRHFEEDFASEPRREDKPPEKQTPVEETRSQRSMSAPPENRATQNTNTSCRVDNEPTSAPSQHHVDEPAMGKMYSRATPAREPTPTQQQPQQQTPKVCYIPIQVEGRDEPMMPRTPNIQPSGSAEKVFGNERVSPGYPGHARQLPKDMYTSPGKPQMQQPSQQYAQYQQQPPQAHPQQQQQQSAHTPHPQPHPHMQYQQPQQAPPTYQGQGQTYMKPQQQQPPQPHYPQQQQKPKQQQQAPPTAPLSNDPLEKIKCVRNDVMELMSHVENFRGTRKDREYLYLDEMLTRNLIKLDNVETEGKENIRLARKEAIKCIQTCISNLEARAQAKEHEARAAAEAAGQANAPEPVDPNSGLIQSEQQHIAENQEPEKFKSQATLVIGGVSKPGVDVVSDTPKVEDVKTAETPITTEPMDVDSTLSQEIMQNVADTTSAATNDTLAPVPVPTPIPDISGAAAELPNPSELAATTAEHPVESGATTNTNPSQPAEIQQPPTQK